MEFILTAFIIICAVSLFGASLYPFGVYSIFILCAGLIFSWRINLEPSFMVKVATGVCIVGVLIWAAYSILNTSFFYKEILLILIKTVLIFEVILSFNAFLSLGYMQSLGLTVFMAAPLFISGFNLLTAVLISVFFIFWFVLIRIKFYVYYRDEENSPRGLKILAAPLIILAVCAIFSWLIFAKFTLGEYKKGGLFPEDGIGGTADSGNTLDDYYKLQDQLQDKIMNLIPRLDSSDQQHEMLLYLQSLIKESSYVMEVERAEQGLISRLNTPGPGLDPGELEGIVFLLKSYLDKKQIINPQSSKAHMMDMLKKQSYGFLERLSILSKVNQIQYGSSRDQVQSQAHILREAINNSAAQSSAKDDLKDEADRLSSWRELALYRNKKRLLEKQLSLITDASLEQQMMKLVSDICNTEDFAELKQLRDVASASMSQEPVKKVSGQIEELVDLKIDMLLNEKIGKLEEKIASSGLENEQQQELLKLLEEVRDAQGKQELMDVLSKIEDTLKLNSLDLASETALLSNLSLPEPVAGSEVSVQAEDRPANSSESLDTHKRLMHIALVLSIIIFSLVASTFLVFYFLNYSKRRIFIEAYRNNPREFIINLYANARIILRIFGLRGQEFLVPLIYAELAKNRYGISNNFLTLTTIFEEAKYSRHALNVEQANQALGCYNMFIKEFVPRHKWLPRFFKCLKAFLSQKPLLIPIKSGM